jgi:hypothetical protein
MLGKIALSFCVVPLEVAVPSPACPTRGLQMLLAALDEHVCPRLALS